MAANGTYTPLDHLFEVKYLSLKGGHEHAVTKSKHMSLNLYYRIDIIILLTKDTYSSLSPICAFNTCVRVFSCSVTS